MRRAVVAVTGVGVFLGVCAGIVQLTYGSAIPDWTGNKSDTTGLGLATIGLSVVAGAAIWWMLRISGRWGRTVCALAALASAVLCFTTVGRLWYVPGPLLVVAASLAFLAVRRQPKGN